MPENLLLELWHYATTGRADYRDISVGQHSDVHTNVWIEMQAVGSTGYAR